MRDYTQEELDRMRIMMNGETALDKIKRKSREEPLVPAGKIRVKYIMKTLLCL
jgi:hypothetical protein